MKLFRLFFILLATPLIADEVETLQELIETTQKNLEGQLQAMQELKAYKEMRGHFLADPDNGKLGTLMVRRAMKLFQELEAQHLAHLFPTEFVDELRFFTQVGEDALHRSKNR
ncbi:MAG: hypothetical protein S4CHLAM45_11530 [Chlamydiales bacterium]|nr:hypothetical protein [Chlamydiales bacterium]MCH9619645.1 hypothetical protein [Chlamydiales bacterium]MCH9623251.1 hypothetical protein [Chlamydiales bacterium]